MEDCINPQDMKTIDKLQKKLNKAMRAIGFLKRLNSLHLEMVSAIRAYEKEDKYIERLVRKVFRIMGDDKKILRGRKYDR